MALAEQVGRVLAFDTSAAMLTHARHHPHVTYAQAPAEALPAALDVLTVAQAFHWLGRNAFLAEARRTLKPGGVLVLYDDFSLGEMPGGLRRVHGDLLAPYLAPPRHRYEFGEAEARGAGFSWHEERFQHPLPLTRRELVSR